MWSVLHCLLVLCPQFYIFFKGFAIQSRKAFLICKEKRTTFLGGWCVFYSAIMLPTRALCNYLRGFLMAACAAARRAMGTRKGEQLT